MGQGFLRWALNNRALFRTIMHPDVTRFADQKLKDAMHHFSNSVQSQIQASQSAGRHANAPLPIVSLYTNAVPFGAAMLLINPLLNSEQPQLAEYNQEQLIEELINLVVPL